MIALWPDELDDPLETWKDYQKINHGALNYTLLLVRADAAIEDMLVLLVQFATTISQTQGELLVMHDELKHTKNRLRVAENVRDRAEKNYDGACGMMEASRGPDGWEVFDDADGEKSIRSIDWKGRAETAEAALARLTEGTLDGG